MEKKKILLIYNPVSGKGHFGAALSDVLIKLTAAGYETTVRPTLKSGEIPQIISDLDIHYDVIACSGGDGTLDELVNATSDMNDKPKLGYIPAGSTNDFAASLGISSDPVSAVERIINGNIFNCDIGSFNGKRFVYVAAFGLFTEVSYATDQNLKNVMGHAAYVLSALASLGNVKPCHMKIEADDTIYEDDYILGIISNTMSIGGFKGVFDESVVMDDGLFEVLLVKMPKDRIDFNFESMEFAGIEGILHKYVVTFKASHLKIASESEVPWTLDGEYGGSPKEIEIINLNKAFPILV